MSNDKPLVIATGSASGHGIYPPLQFPQLTGGIAGGLVQYAYAPKITKREALLRRMKENDAKLVQLSADQGEIAEALRMLDEAPMMERLDNLITKILG